MIDEPRGMGGWLLVFTLSLCLRCLLSLVSVFTPLSLITAHPGSTGILVALAVASLGLAIYTGWMVSSFVRLKPEAPRRLPSYFAFLLAYGLFGVCLPYLSRDATLTPYLATFATTGMAMLLYIGIWVGYFKNSRRVANTFGRPVATT